MAAKTIVDFANLIKDYTKKQVSWADNAVLGAHNLLKITAENSTGDISVTINKDDSVSLSGSSTSSFALDLRTYTGADFKKFGNKITLSGGDTKAYVAIRTSAWAFIGRSYGADVEIDTSTLADATTYYVTIGINANVNVDGLVLYPMIRNGNDSVSAWGSLALSNEVLSHMIQTEVVTASLSDEGHKEFSFTKGEILSADFYYNADFYYSVHASENPSIAIGHGSFYIEANTNITRSFKVKITYLLI